MSSSLRFRNMMAVFFLVLVSLLVLATADSQLGLEGLFGPKLDVGYVTTKPDVVNGMLKIAEVNENDTVYDLGCGDGRIVIAAAKEHGAKGVGIDLNPKRIAEARDNARSAGVEDRVKFEVGDIFKQDFSDATVVMLYILPEMNRKLRPQLWKQLKVGSRVVSNESDMGPEWPAEKTEQIDGRNVHYWTIRDEHKKAAV